MKHFIVTLLVGFWLLGPHAFADVNAKNGISITTASTINGKTPNSAFNGLTITSGGSPSYIESVAPGSTTNDENIQNTDTLGTKITLTAGTVSKIGLYVTAINATNPVLKIALLDSSYTVLGNGSVTVTGSAGTINAWSDVTGLSVAVSSGDYYVAYVCSTFDSAVVGRKVTTGTGTTLYNFSVNYAAFPTGLGSPSVTGGTAAVRVEITP